MDNISKILDAITAEGKEEAEKIRNAAAADAAGIKGLYAQEAAVEEEAILKKADKAVEEIKQRGVSQAGIESRNIRLKIKRQVLEKTFALALEKLAQLPTDEKQQLYTKLIVKCAETGKAEILLNEEDKNAFGKELAKKASKLCGTDISLAEQTGNFSGGLVLLEGDVETNCTFEVLVDDIKKEKEAEIAAMIFA